ncbi:IclR family transcriptional regulator [Thalassotalea sp. PLHSN55]|uniref:IclR family transcriptional regulator n=1 Tax=Thalassotalea sp. PLHSN55 TaxID=3435888 RepID=UPI003F828B85
MTTDKTNKYAVPALDKGLDILEFLAASPIPLSQTEIAHAIGRGANEIYRVLIGLENRGYLTRDEKSGKYSVSLKLFSLSRKISPVDQLRQTAIPIMEDFSATSGYASHLSLLYQSKVMVVVNARSHAPISLDIAEGTLFPAVRSTAGKLLIAHSNEAVKQLILARDENYQQFDKNEKSDFEQALKTMLSNGYLVQENQITAGVTDCAAIIGQAEGAIIAVFAVSTLSSTLNDEHTKQQLTAAVKATALKISEQLSLT